MAPEAPGNLVVIDLRFQKGQLKGYAEYVEYPPDQTSQVEATGRWFYALWNTRPRGSGFTPVGGGIVYIQDLPPGYRISQKTLVVPDSLGNNQYAYRHRAEGAGLMFVLILPEGYILANSQPMPKSVKVFKNRRLGVYWTPQGAYGTSVKVTWQIREFSGDLRLERDRINADIDTSENVPDT